MFRQRLVDPAEYLIPLADQEAEGFYHWRGAIGDNQLSRTTFVAVRWLRLSEWPLALAVRKCFCRLHLLRQLERDLTQVDP